ncbi:protein pop-1-like isoform X2 [Trachinotus anak]
MTTPGPSVVQAAPMIYQVPLYQQNAMQAGHQYSQPDTYSQGQFDNMPTVRIAQDMMQNLVPVGVVNGEVVYGIPAERFTHFVSPAPPPKTPMSKKRKRESQEDDGCPYIKKPPNAFMLFRKEQSPNVIAGLNITDSALVNTVLGMRWKALSKEEQAKYYEQANREKQLHAQQFPNWSCSNNYGKKRKRVRRKAPTTAEASASRPKEVTGQAKNLYVTPVEPAVMETATTQTAQPGTVEVPHTQTGVTEAPVLVMEDPCIPTRHIFYVTLPDTETPVTVPVCDTDDLPWMYEHRPQCTSPPVYCVEPTHQTTVEEQDTLMTEQLEQILSSLHNPNCSPLHFYLD